MSSSSRAAFLRRVPVLSGLDDELLSRLASEVTEAEIRAGEWLMRRGDEGDSLYLIRSGRLEVIAEGPPETVIRVLRRGAVLGELALLTEEVRSASVRARRDSELLELGRRQFEELISDAPGFALGLTRAMGAQLAASRTPAVSPEPPRRIAALPLDQGAPVAEAADLMLDELRRHGSVAKLTSEPGQDSAEMFSRLERAESENDRVLLLGDSPTPGDEWTDFCVREADSLFALSRGSPSREWLDHPDALVGCELVVLADAVTDEVLEALQPREVQVLPGGGARAFAHIGVMQELAQAGVRIDRIGSVSLGSLVGAGIAAGHRPDDLAGAIRRAVVDMNPTGDYTLPLFSIIRGARVRSLLRGFFGDRRIAELRTRYFSVSCDLINRQPVVHKTGPLFEAVQASLSIPGVFPPLSNADGQLL